MISNISTLLPPLSLPKAEADPHTSGAKDVSAQKNDFELNDQQQAEVKRLQKIDREVKAHEAAHKNAGGQYAGSASFSYAVGPDGNRYAVGGEVSIDVATIKDDPEATLAKLDVVIAAALAPAKPSAQDRKVAAAAVAARNQARGELLEKKRAEGDEQDQKSPTFDVNDFGDTPVVSVNKAYASGNDLGEYTSSTGNSLSVTS
mgnify:FL=1|jgi:SprA-related family|tara:strand:- start:233588 stop:234196 length:609 start_codon:yes stop_codon:yes gene_type:complete